MRCVLTEKGHYYNSIAEGVRTIREGVLIEVVRYLIKVDERDIRGTQSRHVPVRQSQSVSVRHLFLKENWNV